jgi:uncharacterized membrane protein
MKSYWKEVWKEIKANAKPEQMAAVIIISVAIIAIVLGSIGVFAVINAMFK